MYLYICSTGNHIFGGQITRAPSLRVSVYKLHIVQRNQAPLPIQWSFQPPRLFGFSHICDDDIWLEGQLRFIVCLALVQCPSRPFFGCFVCIVRVIPHHLETSRQTSRQWRGHWCCIGRIIGPTFLDASTTQNRTKISSPSNSMMHIRIHPKLWDL